MHFEPSQVYLVQNGGNNNQQIFFNDDHYRFFLRKIRSEWLPWCHILGYCLVPTQFRFLVIPIDSACLNIIIKEKESHLQIFSKTIGKTLSSYAKAINLELHRSGTLFQKKTRAKRISKVKISTNTFPEYLEDCLNEMHREPVKRGLVKSPDDWPFSSAMDYGGLRNETLCNTILFYSLCGKTENEVIEKIYPNKQATRNKVY
jgi:putative transposase